MNRFVFVWLLLLVHAACATCSAQSAPLQEPNVYASTIAWSADGRFVASVHDDVESHKPWLYIWDVSHSPRQLMAIRQLSGRFIGFVGNDRFCVEEKDVFRIRYWRDGRTQSTLKGAIYSYDQKNLVFRNGKNWSVLKLPEGKWYRGISGWPYAPYYFSPKLTKIAVEQKGEVQIWDFVSGQLEATLRDERLNTSPAVVRPVVFSKDEKLIATSGDDPQRPFPGYELLIEGDGGGYGIKNDFYRMPVKLWDVASGRLLQTFHFDNEDKRGLGAPEAIGFSNDNRTLAAVNADQVILIDAIEKRIIKTLKNIRIEGHHLDNPFDEWGTHKNKVLQQPIEISPDGKMLAAAGGLINLDTLNVRLQSWKSQKSMSTF